MSFEEKKTIVRRLAKAMNEKSLNITWRFNSNPSSLTMTFK